LVVVLIGTDQARIGTRVPVETAQDGCLSRATACLFSGIQVVAVPVTKLTGVVNENRKFRTPQCSTPTATRSILVQVDVMSRSRVSDPDQIQADDTPSLLGFAIESGPKLMSKNPDKLTLIEKLVFMGVTIVLMSIFVASASTSCVLGFLYNVTGSPAGYSLRPCWAFFIQVA